MGQKANETADWETPREACVSNLLPACRGYVECLNLDCGKTFEAIWELGCVQLVCPFCNTRDTVRIIHGDTRELKWLPCRYSKN